MENSWCTIESDPGVFTDLITKIGVEGVEVEEIYDLSEAQLNALRPIYGLVFLFKWTGESDNREVVTDFNPKDIFFARQVITNACATQAILSILLNAKSINLGKQLIEFKKNTNEFNPELRGTAIGNIELIRTVHNSYARPEPFITVGERVAQKEDDLYHFISYVPINGRLYELDGLKQGPIDLGPCTDSDWISKICPVIQKRINTYAQTEIRFNLMAVIASKLDAYKKELAALEKEQAALKQTVNTNAKTDNEDKMQVDSDTNSETQAKLIVVEDKLVQVKRNIANEQEKRKRWQIENARRKHNYIPFIVNMLQVLADKGELIPLINKAKNSQAETK